MKSWNRITIFFFLSRCSLSLSQWKGIFVFIFLPFLQTSHILQSTECLGREGSGALWTAGGATHQLGKVKFALGLQRRTSWIFWMLLNFFVVNIAFFHNITTSISVAVVTSTGTFSNWIKRFAVHKSWKLLLAPQLVSKCTVCALTPLAGPSTCKPLPDFPHKDH